MHDETLSARMRAYAEAQSLSAEHPLVIARVKLELALEAKPFEVSRVLAAWAVARLAWREATGEPLV